MEANRSKKPKSSERLSQSFSDSLNEEVKGCVSDIAEVGLDSFLDDGILKDIPFISTVVSVYHIGNSIRDMYNLKKLLLLFKK